MEKQGKNPSQIIVKLVSQNDASYKRAIEEINFFADQTYFVSVDIEKGNVRSGCTLIQVGVMVPPLRTFPYSISTYKSVNVLQQPSHRDSIVYLFDITHTFSAETGFCTIPSSLKNLLESKSIMKVVCGLESDKHMVNESGSDLITTVDIQHLAKSLGFQSPSLKNLSQQFALLKKMRPRAGNGPSGSGYMDPSKSAYMDYDYAAYDAYLTLESYLKIIGYDNLTEARIEDTFVTLDELMRFWTWINSSVATDRVQRQVLIRMASNGYGDWKDLLRSTSIIKIEKAITNLIAIGYIKIDDQTLPEDPMLIIKKSHLLKSTTKIRTPPELAPEMGQCQPAKTSQIQQWLPIEDMIPLYGDEELQDSSIVTESDALAAYNRTKVAIPAHGIKIGSYVKCLLNTRLGRYPCSKSDAEQYVYMVVDKLVELGKFAREGNLLFQRE